MSRDLIIGVDAGTSVIKSIAFSTRGEEIASAAVPNRYETLAGGGVEQDMRRTWADTATTLRGLAEKVPDLAQRALAVAITGQGDGTWLIDTAGEPVAPGWLWLDSRAASIVEEIRASDAGPAHYRTTGSGLAACQQGPQLLWLLKHRPEVLARAATAFHCKDWLYFNLTGVRATDPSEATFSFGDFRTRRMSDAVLEVLGLSRLRHLLPPTIEGTEHWDGLSAQAASATGLKAGTPVVLGYVDVLCTALGSGILDEGASIGCTIIGSTGMHMRLARGAEAVVLNSECTGYTMPLPERRLYAQMQSNLAGTLNIDWLIDLAIDVLNGCGGVERSRRDIIASLDERVLAARPGSVLFHPYISEAGERGPFIDASARASFIGLATGHAYADLMRAVYEGLGFAARDCYGAMGDIPHEIRLSGGAARSRAIRAIMAAALDASVRTSTRGEAGAAGVAMMAAVSLGLYEDMAACAADWVMPLLGPPEPPDPVLARSYSGMFAAYRKAREALVPVWHAMARMKGAG